MATLYENLNTGDSNKTDLQGSTIFLAQSFTPAIAHTLTKVVLKWYKTGSPGTLNVTIEGNTVGTPDHPDNVAIYSGSYDGDTLGGATGAFVDITLTGSTTLNAGTKYWIVVNGPSVTGANYLSWRYAASTAYTGGDWLQSAANRSSWTAVANRDFMFEEWGDAAPIPLAGSSDSASSDSGNLVIALALAGAVASVSVLAAEIGFPRALAGPIAGSSLFYAAKLQVPLGEREAVVLSRPQSYDPDKTWDEETKSWVSTQVKGPNSHKQTIVIISELGSIYFGEV